MSEQDLNRKQRQPQVNHAPTKSRKKGYRSLLGPLNGDKAEQSVLLIDWLGRTKGGGKLLTAIHQRISENTCQQISTLFAAIK